MGFVFQMTTGLLRAVADSPILISVLPPVSQMIVLSNEIHNSSVYNPKVNNF